MGTIIYNDSSILSTSLGYKTLNTTSLCLGGGGGKIKDLVDYISMYLQLEVEHWERFPLTNVCHYFFLGVYRYQLPIHISPHDKCHN